MHDLTINLIIIIASSPGHSQFSNDTCRTFEQRISLNSWEWPGARLTIGTSEDSCHYSIRLSIVYHRAFRTEGAFI